MKRLGVFRTAACAALLFAALTPRAAKADEWDKKTIVTFSDTVQVPGATLPAGKYVFKLAESSAERFVVQIFNERENHVFATVIAIPNYRMKVPDKTVITFYEVPAGQPEPIKAWFYPGDNLGRQFLYRGAEAALISKAAHETVPTEESTAVAANTTPTPVAPEPPRTVEPEPAPVAAEPAPVVATPEPQPQPETHDDVAANTAPQTDGVAPTEPSSLPATGSQLPMVGLIGLLSMAAALTIRAIRSAS